MKIRLQRTNYERFRACCVKTALKWRQFERPVKKYFFPVNYKSKFLVKYKNIQLITKIPVNY